ncbi:MAG: DapH/DapD/GlmU-related protein [Legionellaceae bacterium]|nr:DapH/DapD/GlmU-related protein [Legionellaceae bacterium]
MSKEICIFGAGGFAKEVFFLAKECMYTVNAFIDIHSGSLYGIKIETDDYFDPKLHLAVVAVGNPMLREKIVNQIIKRHGDDVFVSLISPSANRLGGDTIQIGKGSIICPNCVLTCDISLGDFTQLNLATTIGHDVKADDFFTTAPGAHINGNMHIGKRVYFGSNASTKEGVNICDDVTVGAAACVTRHISEAGTYVGTPAQKLMKK